MLSWPKVPSTHKTIYVEMEETFTELCKFCICSCGIQAKISLIQNNLAFYRVFKKNQTHINAKIIIFCVEDSLISQHSYGNDMLLHGLNKK